MTVAPALHLHSNPSLQCAYCGRREEMPAEAAERHRFVRLRLQQLERARQTAEAPLTQYKQIKMAMIPGAVFLIFGVGINTVNVFTHKHVGPPPGLEQLFPLALITGMLAGWAGMLLTYRSLVQPLLTARPPERAGMPATCRSCGGDLPAVKTANVTCPYCRADNVLGSAATEKVGHILEGEFQAKMTYARAGHKDPNVYSRPTKAFYTWFVGGIVFGLILIQASLTLFM